MCQFQRSSVFVLSLVVFFLPFGSAKAQFTDVSSSVGINVTHDGASVADMGLGTGAAWFDYDNDGDLDLYMTMRTGANFLFQNNGGTFTDVAAAAGVADASNDGSGVAAADYNNDGCVDMYLANSITDVLYRNNCDGTFTNVYAGSGLETSGERRGTSASWGDYDNDGFVDLYVAHHYPLDGTSVPDDKSKGQDYLYYNNGDGTFTDVTDAFLGDDREKASFIGSWTDFDNDGDLDIYMIADCPFDAQDPMRLWRNDGGTDGATNWTFTNVASSVGADWCQNGMGIAVGDYDKDGFQDYFYTDNGSVPSAGGLERAGTLMLDNNGSTFTDVTDIAGVSSAAFSWGGNFFDYDLDGWEDLFMAAGSLNDFTPFENKLWQSDGNGTSFTDVSVAQGVDDGGRTRTSVYADYDEDGDPDLFIVNYAGQARLYRNDNGGTNNWLIVDLQGVTSNRDGIGAKVEVTTAGGTQTHEVRSGSSLGGGDDVAAYFGFGTDGSITNLEVTWPSGTVQNVTGVGMNQRILVVESTTTGGGGDLFTDVTNSAGLNVTHQGNPADDMGIGTGAAWFDYDQDGDLDLYMTNRVGANHLFENNGGSFTDVAAAAGVADASNDGSGVAAADFNNDGCVDLYLANTDNDVLFENNCDGTFTDITTGSGLEASEERRGTSASWGDYDGDGFVDLYVSHHMPFGQNFTGDGEQDYLFHNDGGTGNFTEVTDMLLGTDRVGRAFISGWTDYDNDGDSDVYLVSDCPFGQNSAPMRLFRNDGGTNATTDWTFTEVASTVNADWCQNGMGLAVGDYNRDGWMDLFFTDNGATTTEYPASPKRVGAVLLRNDNGSFTETTDAAQVDNNHFSWGANFFDYDLDGWQDLFMVGGAMAPENLVENILWNNDGDGTFTDESANGGGINDDSNTRTSAYADYDGDGDMDMFIVNYNQGVKLFRNDNNNGNNWLIVDLQGVSSNRDGIGARLELSTPDGVTQHYEVRSGSSLGAGDDVAAYFGIGNNGSITNLEITWPSGTVQNVGGLGINQRHLVVEDGSATSTLSLSPLSVDFDAIEIGSSSAPVQMTMTNNGVDAIDVTDISISGADAADFSHDFSGSVMISGGGSSTFNVTFSPQAAAAPSLLPEGVLYRVNAGGDLVDDWEEDSATNESPYVLPGATSTESDNTTPTLDASVPAGTPSDLFQTFRRDATKADPRMEWDFPVTAGEEITVRLFFAELSRCSADNREFDVEIEGALVLDDFDVYTEAGGACHVGIMREFTVTPADGNLDIDFPLANGRPSIVSAIEILGEGGGGTTNDPRSAQLTVSHTGSNPAVTADLMGEATTTGGNVAPTASFSFTTSGLTASFTDASSDSDGSIVSWDWDFGDGNTSTGQNPDITYATGGTYTVMLTVTDDEGATGSTSQSVTVSDGNVSPTAAFNASVNDLQVDFTDASTDSDGSVVSWSWDFGDGNTSTSQNPSHTYGAYGTYNVMLTVTDDQGATGSVSQDVSVNDPNAVGAFITVDGMVVMEAESYFTNTPRSDHDWVETTAQADYSGSSAMMADPNTGTNIKKNSVSTSPEMTYDVDFADAGTYFVWARIYAAQHVDNTIHMGLNDFPSASKMEASTLGEWTWTNVDAKGNVLTIGVTNAGLNTVHVWMREDGAHVDKVILTQDVAFVPTGQGPAESPRSGAAPASERSGLGRDLLTLEGASVDLPTEFSLGDNYPNPFNPTTTINFALPEDASVTLEVYDTMGRRIATLMSSQLAAGRYEAQWNGRNEAGAPVASGIYLYRIKAGSFTETKTMLLMK